MVWNYQKVGYRVGEKNLQHRLTLEEVVIIKMALNDSIRQSDLAKAFKVRPCTIGSIKHGQTWRWFFDKLEASLCRSLG